VEGFVSGEKGRVKMERGGVRKTHKGAKEKERRKRKKKLFSPFRKRIIGGKRRGSSLGEGGGNRLNFPGKKNYYLRKGNL